MSRAGFTLVEVVVSLLLASVVVLLAHRGFHTAAEVSRRASTTREQAARAAGVHRQLVAWIRAAYVDPDSPSWGFEGIAAVTDEAPDDRLRFSTLSSRVLPSSGMARVDLFIDRDPSTPEAGLVAHLSAAPEGTAAGDLPAARAHVVSLVPGAMGLRIRYRLDANAGGAWTNEWVSTARMPAAVEVQILGDSVPALLQLPILIVPSGS